MNKKMKALHATAPPYHKQVSQQQLRSNSGNIDDLIWVQLPVDHAIHCIGELGHRVIVGRHHQRDALDLHDLAQQLEQRAPRARIELAGRLVGQQQLGS